MVSPEYDALMEWLPAINVFTLRVARLLVGATEPSTVVPSVKVTVPVVCPANWGVSATINVTDWPHVDGLVPELTAGPTEAWFMVSENTGEVLAV